MFLSPLVAVALCVPVAPEGLVGRIGSEAFRSPVGTQLVGLSADGRRVYTSSFAPNNTERPALFVWDAATGQQLARHPYAEPGDNLHPVALGPDGLRVPVTVGGSGACVTRLVDPDTGRTRSSTPPYQDPPIPFQGGLGRLNLTTTVFGPHGWFYRRTEKSHRLTDPATGRTIPLTVQGDSTSSVGFREDGKLFFLMPTDGPTQLYNLPSGKLAAEIPRTNETHIDGFFTPDGKSLGVWVKWAAWYEFELWDIATKSRRVVFDKQDLPGRVVFAPDGKTFARLPIRVGAYHPGGDWEVRAVADGRVLARFPSEPYSQQAAFSPDGRTLYLQTGDRTVVPWDVATGKPAASAPDPVGEITRFRYTADGKIVALVGSGVSTFDAAGKELSRVRLPRTPDYFYSLRFNTAGTRMVFVDVASQLTSWDFRTGNEVKRRVPRPDFNSAPDEVLTPDASMQVEPWGGVAARILNVATGERVKRNLPPEWQRVAGGASQPIALVAASSDGRRLALASVPYRIDDRGMTRSALSVFDVTADTPPRTAVVEGFDFTALAFSPDGRLLVAGGGSLQAGLRVFDAATLRPIATVPNFGVVPHALGFSPDGRVVAMSAAFHEVRVFETASWRERAVLPSPARVYPWGWSNDSHRDLFAFSPDGRRLATATPGGGLLLWDTRKLGPKPERPSSLDAAWADLLGEDARKAHAAIGVFAAFPELSLPFLKAKLSLAAGPDAKAMAAQIALLDSDDFAEREAATKAFAAWGRHAEDALRAALRTHESPEVRKRLTELLNRLVVEVPTPEDRRAIRAVEAVEWIDTPAARELLKAWAAGAAGARLTRDATAALARGK